MTVAGNKLFLGVSIQEPQKTVHHEHYRLEANYMYESDWIKTPSGLVGFQKNSLLAP